MVNSIYRGTKKKYFWKVNPSSFRLNDSYSVFTTEEADYLNIDRKNIFSEICAFDFVQTQNDLIVQAIGVTVSGRSEKILFHSTYWQKGKNFVLVKNEWRKFPLFGNKVNKLRLQWFVLVRFVDSPFFNDPVGATFCVLKNQDIRKVNEEMCMNIYSQGWYQKILRWEVGKMAGRTVKEALESCKINYETVIKNWDRISKGNNQPALEANDRLYELLKQQELEDQKSGENNSDKKQNEFPDQDSLFGDSTQGFNQNTEFANPQMEEMDFEIPKAS